MIVLDTHAWVWWAGETGHLSRALALPRVVELRLDARTATRAGALDRDSFPGDPADRIVYATAVECGARLLSRDTDIAAFDAARVVW